MNILFSALRHRKFLLHIRRRKRLQLFTAHMATNYCGDLPAHTYVVAAQVRLVQS